MGRTDAEAEAPNLWVPDAKSQIIGKDPDAGNDWRQEKKGTTEDKMVGWHHWFNGHEFEQTPGDREGQRSQTCCSLWGHKESDTIEWLNNNNNQTSDLPVWVTTSTLAYRIATKMLLQEWLKKKKKRMALLMRCRGGQGAGTQSQELVFAACATGLSSSVHMAWARGWPSVPWMDFLSFPSTLEMHFFWREQCKGKYRF